MPIQKLNDSTYKFYVNNEADVAIGDASKSEFDPTIRIEKWDENIWLEIKRPHSQDADPTEVKVGDDIYQVKWATQEEEDAFYPVAPVAGLENGGFEFAVILKSKPSSNIIEFDIDYNNVEFYKQLPYDEQPDSPEDTVFGVVTKTATQGLDADSNVIINMPENVLNSYAVYRINKLTGLSAKVGHIFRPELTDDNGDKIWADLDINTTTKKLTITIDQNYLDNAAYPVLVDPTFGYNTTGSTDVNIKNEIIGIIANPGESGTVNSLHTAIEKFDTGDYAKMALYAVDGTLVSPQSEEREGAGAVRGWEGFNVSGGISVSDQDYVVAVWSSNTVRLARDTGGTNVSKIADETYGAWPSSVSFSDSDNFYSTYADYNISSDSSDSSFSSFSSDISESSESSAISPSLSSSSESSESSKSGLSDSSLSSFSSVSSESSGIPWFQPIDMDIITGAINGGDLADIREEDDQYLLLDETNDIPGFEYNFRYENVSDESLQVSFAGYYDGNQGHDVKLIILNDNLSQWENVTQALDDFPSAGSKQYYNFVLPDPLTDYLNSGVLELKVIHTSSGSQNDDFYIDEMVLAQYSVSSGSSDSSDSSNSSNASPSSSLSGSSDSSYSFSPDKKTIDTLNPSTYRILYNPNAEVEFGDINENYFVPHVKVRRWNKQFLDLKYNSVDSSTVEEILDGNNNKRKVKWKENNNKNEVHFYAIEPNDQMAEGGFEFEVLIDKKPATNLVEFDIEVDGLIFEKQLPYNQQPDHPEDIAAGVVTKTETQGLDGGSNVIVNMPDNVVNSYAVYKDDHSNFVHADEEDKYKMGKAFHIFRPKAVDKKGNEVWCDLDVNTETKKLTVIIPQAFIDSANFPVIVDPTFGYTTIGATSFDLNSDNYIGFFGNPGVDTEVTSLHAALGDNWDGGDNVKLALYDTSGNLESGSETEELSTGHGTTAFVQFDVLSSPYGTGNQDYVVICQAETTTALYRDGGSGDQSYYVGQSYGAWVDPVTFLRSSNIYSTYATYQAASLSSLSSSSDSSLSSSSSNSSNISPSSSSVSSDSSQSSETTATTSSFGKTDSDTVDISTHTTVRYMGGTSPAIDNMVAKALWYRSGGSGTLSIAMYTGGALDDPTSATRQRAVANYSVVTGWNRIPITDFVWDESIITWVGWAFSGAGPYYEGGTPPVAAGISGDWQNTRGRWEQTTPADYDETTLLPTGPGAGSFGDFWYNVYVEYDVLSQSSESSFSSFSSLSSESSSLSSLSSESSLSSSSISAYDGENCWGKPGGIGWDDIPDGFTIGNHANITSSLGRLEFISNGSEAYGYTQVLKTLRDDNFIGIVDTEIISSYVIQIRGSSSSFAPDAVSPTWENYTGPVNRVWRYVQLRVIVPV